MAFTVIAPTATQPDKPLDSTLMTALVDRDDYLKTQLETHTHDGSGSATIDTGPNAIRNGSFEDGTNGWTISNFTGGSHTTDTSNDMDGATALAITSTSTVNGGAVALSNEFRSCIGGLAMAFLLAYKASTANVSSRARVIWYDGAQSQISTSDIYTSTNTPTAASTVNTVLTAPSTARFYKVELTGGIPGSGSATGTVYFDGVKAEQSLVRSINGLTGAVTVALSVNGQTGAVVTTNLYSIGGLVIGREQTASGHAVNTTIAGSSLYACGAEVHWDSTAGQWLDGGGNNVGATLVNTGSWLCVSPCPNSGATRAGAGLWVRYA